jgi:drug/metabolite transporter (DMT)-like permease
MKPEFLLLITLSGFFHAFYNFLMRRAHGSRLYLTGIFAVGAAISIIVTLASGTPVVIPFAAVPFVLAASFFYAFYQLFISFAYERGDIAVVYPMAMLSPLFIPLLAFLFLGEVIPIAVWTGICIAIAGTLLVQLNFVSIAELNKIVRFSKDYGAARLALAASFMYAIGSVFDKSRISEFDILIYMNFILIFMALMLASYSAIFEKEQLMPYFSKHFKSLLLGGGLLFLSFLTFRIALQHVYVSIAVPVRLSSIVFAVLFGVIILKEKLNRNKAIGIFIVILGIIFIQWFRSG